jgi:hypothetical protein
MTVVATRRPEQAERLTRELTSQGYACECAGCLLHTDAPAGAVIAAGVRTDVQSESMAGIDEGPAGSLEEAVGRYTRCRSHTTRHHTRH